jgi:hypothetical protein
MQETASTHIATQAASKHMKGSAACRRWAIPVLIAAGLAAVPAPLGLA